MSTEMMCSSHRAQAGHLCLYHIEPLCAECKFNDKHKFCPKDSISIKDNIPASNTDRGQCYDQCMKDYRNTLELQQKSSGHNERSATRLKDGLDNLFKEIKAKVHSVQEETEKCIDNTKTDCLRKSSEIELASKDLLTEIGNHMKGLCQNTQDITDLVQQAGQYKRVIDSKRKELESCDLEYQSTLALACLLDPEKIVFRQAILTCQLIDSIFPPVVDSKLHLIGELDSKSTSDKRNPWITGCIVLRNGTIALVDSANCSVKLYAANGFSSKSEISFGDSSPFDITEKDQGFCVSLPNVSKIRHVKLTSDNTIETWQDIITTKSKCFGVEYGGDKLVVSCHLSAWYKFTRSLCWQFCVYGKDNNLLQVIEKDKLGVPFVMSNGYFNYCPFRDQILFLTNNGKAKQFHLFGPSNLEFLGELGCRNDEVITALTSVGSMIITSNTVYEYVSHKSSLHLQNYSQSAKSNIDTGGICPCPMYCDARSRILVVCEEFGHWWFPKKDRTVYVYEF